MTLKLIATVQSYHHYVPRLTHAKQTDPSTSDPRDNFGLEIKHADKTRKASNILLPVFTGEGTKKLPLNSGPGIGIIGRRLLGSVAGVELFPPGFRTSTYFLAAERERERKT